MKPRLVSNPPNPYLTEHAEWLEPPPKAKLEVYEEHARTILSKNESPDLGFSLSVNPYRGCQHSCCYCYARTYHEYLGLGAGTDFDTKIVAKVNAPELLNRELGKRSWKGETIEFSGVTDCYQPIEATYGLTRKCLEVCLEWENPVAITTKGFMILRDVSLLAELHRRAGVAVGISIPFLDRDVSRIMEPQAPPPNRRLQAVHRLRCEGIPVCVLVAPIVPGLSDREIPKILKRAAEAGATSAACALLRLPDNVEAVFSERLREAMPGRATPTLDLLRSMRGGQVHTRGFFKRFSGQGVHWESIMSLFKLWRKRCGLEKPMDPSEKLPASKYRTIAAAVRAVDSCQMTLDFRD